MSVKFVNSFLYRFCFDFCQFSVKSFLQAIVVFGFIFSFFHFNRLHQHSLLCFTLWGLCRSHSSLFERVKLQQRSLIYKTIRRVMLPSYGKGYKWVHGFVCSPSLLSSTTTLRGPHVGHPRLRVS